MADGIEKRVQNAQFPEIMSTTDRNASNRNTRIDRTAEHKTDYMFSMRRSVSVHLEAGRGEICSQPARPTMPNERILVVDDEHDLLELVSYNLTKEGYQVKCATWGEEALEIARQESPDLILLDLMLPGVDGLEVCRKLRANGSTGQVAIVMLTAKSEEGDIVKGLEAGADDYIIKPFTPSVLVARIKSVLRRRNIGEFSKNKGVSEQDVSQEFRHLVTAVSHDLRSPLASLEGWSGVLEEEIDGIRTSLETVMEKLPESEAKAVKRALEQDLPESLGFIKSSVSSLDLLIKALLELPRLGRKKLTFECLDMNELVSEVLGNLSYQIEQNGVHVKVDPLPDVTADWAAMEQIMLNLLSNAVKYLDPSRVGEIEISGQREADKTIFRVKDNGVGIDEEDLERIFDIFQRTGTKKSVPGEGMGLAYAKKLVRRHGGHIWCESQIGVGSSFVFSLSHDLPKHDNNIL
jgi:two-component system sensor histidine kinase/response regulator